jgi:hypothetical protein
MPGLVPGIFVGSAPHLRLKGGPQLIMEPMQPKKLSKYRDLPKFCAPHKTLAFGSTNL